MTTLSILTYIATFSLGAVIGAVLFYVIGGRMMKREEQQDMEDYLRKLLQNEL